MESLLVEQDHFLLASKVQVPPQKPDLVSRQHLLIKLDGLLDPGVNLALVIAPPGFGKTSLVCDWIASRETSFGGQSAFAASVISV